MGCLTNNLEIYPPCKAKKEKTVARWVVSCVRILFESAWEGLRSLKKPSLTIIGNQGGGPLGSVENQNYHIENISGAKGKGQNHTWLMEAAHFLQDDQGVEVARLMLAFMAANPVSR